MYGRCYALQCYVQRRPLVLCFNDGSIEIHFGASLWLVPGTIPC
jgi:hypothetical protein